ncbi:hypothetical protein DL98DRAFT_534717 [Cadophora sp. DSE1049]|nr:hypothetical protein DL98DRAFT_534717 [Cadophora sp. DSE1049]
MERPDRPVRSRQIPLVPEPFSSVTIALLSYQFPHAPKILPRPVGTFVPTFDIPEYRETMTEAQKETMDHRVDTLRRHAIQSSEDEVSEATLETDIRSDVFGYIREDRSLTIYTVSTTSAPDVIAQKPAVGPRSGGQFARLKYPESRENVKDIIC